MTATAGYQAAPETNQTQISYGLEATWGTAPATTFQAVRYISENLRDQKTRSRPGEIPVGRQAVQAVTTQEIASGGINGALSFGTYDDWISSVLGADWGTTTTITGAAGDISAVASGAHFTSTTSTKFQNILVGMIIKVAGFSNSANNGYFRVATKASSQDITVDSFVGALVNETPAGTAATMKYGDLRNGSVFKSVFMQQKLNSAGTLWLRYPGAFASGLHLSGGVGNFLSINFDIVAQQELNQTTDASTGGITAAPTGPVFDTVTGWQGLFVGGAAAGSVLDSFTLDIVNTGAAGQFGMGSSAAQGILQGTLEARGSCKVFFKDFTLYTRFRNETLGAVNFHAKDANGNFYGISLPNAALMNPEIIAGGPGQAVMAQFEIEGNPDPTTGVTVIMARL